MVDFIPEINQMFMRFHKVKAFSLCFPMFMSLQNVQEDDWQMAHDQPAEINSRVKDTSATRLTAQGAQVQEDVFQGSSLQDFLDDDENLLDIN